MPKCVHMNFSANVMVARLEDSGRFMAEVKVECADCGEPFQFLGLDPGINFSGARVSIDGLEANMAIAPTSQVMSPLQRMFASVETKQ